MHVFATLNKGGSESMIINHYRYIDNEQFRFDFVVHTNHHNTYEQEIQQRGGKIFRLPEFRGTNYCSYKKAWKKLIDSNPNWDIVHIHYFTIAWVIAPILKDLGVDVRIVHIHSNKLIVWHKRILFNIFKKRMIHSTSHFLACSQEAGLNIIGKNTHFDVFKNAIETSKFCYNAQSRSIIRTELAIPANKFVIGHIGSFRNYQKNHLFLLDVFKEVKNIIPHSALVLVGDGAIRKHVENYSRQIGLNGDVIFTGVRDDVPQLLSAFDVFVFPSLNEGLGISAIEAQASGLPCLLSDCVPKEAAITKKVSFMSLDSPKKLWAEKIASFNITETNRIEDNEIIKKAGYDIATNIFILKNYYMSLLK